MQARKFWGRQGGRRSRLLCATALILLVLGCASQPERVSGGGAPRIRNVIFLIPDGMSISAMGLARWVQGGERLAIDEFVCGLVRTYNADTPIADSAPAGSAFATGYKTNSPYVSVLPSAGGLWGVPAPEAPMRPAVTVLEAARLAGKATGLVTTCELSNATPAAFSAHTANRKNVEDIIEQEVYNGLSVVFSGGYKFLEGKSRKDGEDLASELRNQGYSYITTRSGFDALAGVTAGESPLVWGLFAPVDLAYDMDRDPSAEPSLEEMTEKAIRLLSADKDGFFLMVEGSKIDWAAHANEPSCLAREILAFDRAVRRALDFAKSRDDTIVIVASDHGTGGVTIGDRTTSSGYDTLGLETFVGPLRAAKKSGAVFASLVREDRSNLEEVLANVYGIKNLKGEERELIQSTKLDAYNGMILIGKLISGRARLGFTTAGHTGDEVCLCLYAPNGSPRLGGTVLNSDIAWYISGVLDLDLKKAAGLLFRDAQALAREAGASAETDSADPANPVLALRKAGTELRFPVNKNYCLEEGVKRQLSGVTVYIPETKSWYIASDAAAYLGK